MTAPVRAATAVFAALFVISLSPPSFAWLLHEHTKITRRGIELLRQRPDSTPTLAYEPLAAAWKEILGARTDDEPGAHPRLCTPFALPASARVVNRVKPCLDFGILPAVGADFACSPEELLRTVEASNWVLPLIEGSYTTEGRLYGADSATERLNEWHADHIRNFSTDPQYLERASGNQAHFALLRMNDDLPGFLRRSARAGATPNAFGFYALYHVAALRLAWEAGEAESTARRSKMLFRAFFAEAYALHYLEDAFSAGHAVGTTGGARERAGTHDFYCENGMEARAWPPSSECPDQPKVKSYFAYGDAFMHDEDVEHAAAAVAASLRDLGFVLGADAAERARLRRERRVLTSGPLESTEALGDDGMNACVLKEVPRGLLRDVGDRPSSATAPESGDKAPGDPAPAPKPGDTSVIDPWIDDTLAYTFMPAYGHETEYAPLFGPLETELVPSLPRASAEMGWFGGLYGSVRYDMAYPYGISGPLSGVSRFYGTLGAGLELGVSAVGITTSTTDAVMFLQVGVLAQSAQLDAPFAGDSKLTDRTGLSFRVRAPYFIVPGDGILMSPFVVAGASWAKWWLVNAAERGPWGIGATVVTAVGGFHFVLGREVGFHWVAQDGWDKNFAFGMDVPILEIKPRTWFAGRFGTAFAWQLGANVDFGRDSRSAGVFLRFMTAARYFPRWGQ